MGRTRKTANLVNDLVGIDTTAKSTFTDIDFSGDLMLVMDPSYQELLLV